MVPHLLLGLGKKHLESTGPIGPDKGWAIQHPKYPTDIDDTLKYGFRLAIMSGASKDSTRPSPSFARSLHLCREWFSAKDATHGTDVLCDARKVSRDPICAQFATKHWVYRRALDSYTDEQQQKKQESQPKCSKHFSEFLGPPNTFWKPASSKRALGESTKIHGVNSMTPLTVNSERLRNLILKGAPWLLWLVNRTFGSDLVAETPKKQDSLDW